MGYRRRKRHPAMGMLTVLVLFALLSFLLCKFVFVVRNIYIEGNSRLSAEEIIRSAELPIGEFIGSVQEEDIAANILDDGKAILKELKIDFPDSVTLVVEERQSAAMMVYGGSIYVLDKDCVVMEKNSAAPQGNLLYISGLEVKSINVGSVLQTKGEQVNVAANLIHALLQKNGMEYIGEANISDAETLVMYSAKTQIQIKLENMNHLEEKIALAVETLKDLESRGTEKGLLTISSENIADFQPDAAVEHHTL